MNRYGQIEALLAGDLTQMEQISIETTSMIKLVVFVLKSDEIVSNSIIIAQQLCFFLLTYFSVG
jgi:hypothetical protein